MPTHTTTQPKVIVLRGHLPGQMIIATQCIYDGYPITIYADEPTEQLKEVSKLSFVQVRIAQQNVPIIDNTDTKLFA